jgi:hypothetical protein
VNAHTRHQGRRNQRRPLPHWKAELRRLDRRDQWATWAPVAVFLVGFAIIAGTLALVAATLTLNQG